MLHEPFVEKFGLDELKKSLPRPNTASFNSAANQAVAQLLEDRERQS